MANEQKAVNAMNKWDLQHMDALPIARPIWDNLISASNRKNYQQFSKDFSARMKANATQQLVETQWQQQPMLCNLKPGADYLGCLKSEQGIRVLWKQGVHDQTSEFLGHLELIVEDNQIKVDGAQVF